MDRGYHKFVVCINSVNLGRGDIRNSIFPFVVNEDKITLRILVK